MEMGDDFVHIELSDIKGFANVVTQVMTAKKKEKEKPKLFDFTPHNVFVAGYCTTVAYAHFRGINEGTEDQVDGRNKGDGLITIKDEKSLSYWLRKTDEFLRSLADFNLTTDHADFNYYLQNLMKARNLDDREKFMKDAHQFLLIYNKRCYKSQECNHDQYWGSRQQLLSGKVIADHIAEEYGPLDPVFGVLLNPTGGRVGKGDSQFLHKILFDYDGIMAHHSAAHDAFGYLITNHGIGPGYNYIGAWGIFGTFRPLAGQYSGIHFWHSTLKKLRKQGKLTPKQY